LTWQQVALPDRLEDAEGFYGLEEIEDVEVVRDEANHHVLFRPSEGADVVEDGTKEESSNVNDEWSGFEDEVAGSPISNQQLAFNTQKADSSETGAPSTRISIRQAEVQADVHFDVLRDVSVEPDADVTLWRELKLSPNVLSAIASLGFTKPTAIQASAIPPILNGHDVIGKAVTGSGKTLAFGIPIFERWMEAQAVVGENLGKSKAPIALVLAPTRELAHQLSDHLTDLGRGLPRRPRIATMTGGLSILKQKRLLENADIIIGTPGRLWEVINDSQGLIERLKQIRFLVVDEADRLLSEGHFKEVEDILDALDREVVREDDGGMKQGSHRAERQTLVFSATFHQGLQQKLTRKSKPGSRSESELLTTQQSMDYLLHRLSFREARPIFVDSNPTSQMATSLQESIVECGATEKDLYLYTLILQNPALKTLVFTNSISSVKRLGPLLQNLNLPAVPLHSTMPQKSRLRSLEKFASSQRMVLVATDVAARGLDIKGIDLIIHYHVPRTADMYIHRSGRTARAENAGRSILLCSPDEVAGVTRLISKVHHRDQAPDTSPVERQLVKRLEKRVDLAKRITEATLAREKMASKDEWLKSAAEELGVDYDSEEFEDEHQRGKRGRGGGRVKKEKEKGGISKAQMAEWRAELKGMLNKRVNLGVSERYLAGGRVDVNALLEGRADSAFLEGR